MILKIVILTNYTTLFILALIFPLPALFEATKHFYLRLFVGLHQSFTASSWNPNKGRKACATLR